MVRAGQLKTTLARALHLPEKKVDYPYRVALEHGEISKGKRGRGGALVTEIDGAKALIALASSYMGGEVIQSVRDFSRLQLNHTAHSYAANQAGEPADISKNYAADVWVETEDGRWELIEFKVPQLQALPPRHTFTDALIGLIKAARDRAFGPPHRLTVTFYGPEPRVGIEIELWVGTDRRYVEKAVYLLPNRREGVEAEKNAFAFEVAVKIDQQPIYAIADLFRPRGCDEQGDPARPEPPMRQRSVGLRQGYGRYRRHRRHGRGQTGRPPENSD